MRGFATFLIVVAFWLLLSLATAAVVVGFGLPKIAALIITFVGSLVGTWLILDARRG